MMRLLKKLSLGLVLLVSLTASAFTWADALLVLDMRNLPILPKHFRTTQDALPSAINKTGLTDLHIAGGAQFSKLALDRVLKRLQTKRITIIDLRQESHGFLNGNAISWYAPGDAENAGLTGQQVEKRQSALLNTISQQESVKTYAILKKTSNERIEKTKMVEFSMRSVSSEAELAYHLNLNYQRIYVQDYHAPTPKQVDRFIEYIKQLPKDQWIYFHCRAGIGRTTTFMALYDIMHNAKKVSFEDIVARQAALGGKDLAALPAPGAYKYRSAVERLNFLKSFYQYAHDNNDHFQTTWTQWSKTHRHS